MTQSRFFHRPWLAALLLTAALLPLASFATERELVIRYESEPFARKGDALITHADLDAFMARIPKRDRAGVLADPKRLEQIINDLVLVRLVAHEAIVEGLMDDPENHAHLYQAAMVYLADRQTERVQNAAELDDYTRQARELYLRNPEAHHREEKVDFTHLLVATNGRTDDEAQNLLEDLSRRVADGEALSALIREYSDDPSAERNRGRFRDVSFDQLDADFAAALRELSQPGEISAPVKTQFGWHLIRLDRYQPEGVPTFEQVADPLRERARRNHRQQVRERYLSELMSPPLEIEPGAVRMLLERYSASFGPSEAISETEGD